MELNDHFLSRLLLHNVTSDSTSNSSNNYDNNSISSTNDFLLGEDLLSVATLVAYPMIVFILMLGFMRLVGMCLALPTVERMKEDYRKKRICNKLITKKVKCCQINKAKNNYHNDIEIQQQGIDDNNLYCPICLDTLKLNDEVSWSKYAKCEHVYHHQCIMLWLMNHNDCPYCRCKFIFTDEAEKYLKKIGQEHVQSEFCSSCGLVSSSSDEPSHLCCSVVKSTASS